MIAVVDLGPPPDGPCRAYGNERLAGGDRPAGRLRIPSFVDVVGLFAMFRHARIDSVHVVVGLYGFVALVVMHYSI